MRLAIVLTAGLGLAACHVESRHGSGEDSSVNISGGENGAVSFDLPFAKGQVNLPASAMAHGNFDIDGVKMIPGATIHGFHVEATNGKSQVTLRFKAPQSPEQVRAYFLDQFRSKNIEASASGDTISGTSKDGDSFQIAVEQGQDGSEGTVRIDGKGD